MDSEHDAEHDTEHDAEQPSQSASEHETEYHEASEPTQPLTQPLDASGPASPFGAGESAAPENAPESETSQSAPSAGGQPSHPLVLRIEVGRAEGDLRVYGREASEVELSSPDLDDDDYEEYAPVQEAPDLLRFARLPDDAELAVPRSALVSIRDVSGDLRVDGLTGGGISVGRVGSDTVITGVTRVELGRVEGDVHVSRSGLVRLREASGDVVLDALADTPVLGRIDGDLKTHGTRGLNARETISGDVQIEGSAADVVIRGIIGGDLVVDGCSGEVHIGTVSGDLRAKVARALIVEGTVAGDCDVTEIGGPVELRGSVGGDLDVSLVGGLAIGGSVGGDAELATVAGEAALRSVGGDLTGDALAGPLVAQSIGGDARLRTSLGEIRLNRVGGDLSITRATAGFIVARVSGDVVLDTPLAAGAEYEVRAAGDISLRVRGDVNARFVAQTLGGEIRTRLPLAVERGRRRNLVGVLGRGDATVTLQSDGGDIYIGAAEGNEEAYMSDQTSGGGSNTGTDDQTDSSGRTWQGSFGGHKFRVRWDPGAWRAGESDTSSSGQGARRGFGFEWEHDPEGDQKAQEDFEQVISDLRDRAENVARSAADQALRYAERAAKRARETDWESIGREVRTAIERAMGELESTVGQFRREFESRRGPGSSGSAGSGGSQRPSGGGAQRVRIEQDEQGDPFGGSPGSGFGSGASASGGSSPADVENRRRAILEELRAGTLTLDEAERRLGELK